MKITWLERPGIETVVGVRCATSTGQWPRISPARTASPSWRKAGRDEGFCVRDVNVRRLNRRWGAVRLPKVGELRLRLSRPLPATTGMARLTLDRAGRWHVAFTLPSRRSTANQLAALSGSTGAWPRPWRSHTALPAR